MARSQSLEADGELDVAATHDVLDLEVGLQERAKSMSGDRDDEAYRLHLRIWH